MGKAFFLAFLVALALVLSGCLTDIAQTDSSRDEKCFLEPDPGPCEAAIPRYYLDNGACKEFLWGGCDGVAPFESLEECRQACGIRVVGIMDTFPGKIVYSTDSSIDTAPLMADCADRGGTFNECGSVCATDAEMCVDVCAFTCELGTGACSNYSVEECPGSCTVCPPCEVCSSISCQTTEFCESIGFDKDWYGGIGVSQYFSEQLLAKAVENLGAQPIEGFEAFSLMDAFPGLEAIDFDGVEASQGNYRLWPGTSELVFEQTEFPEHSAAQTISVQGYKTLLGTLSRRVGINVQNKSDVDLLLEVIA